MRTNFKQLLLMVISVLCIAAANAQPPMGQPGMGMPDGGQQIHIYGKMVNSDGKAISGVSVIILQDKFDTATKKSKSILLKGTTTKANGTFDFTDIALGKPLSISTSAVGYSPYTKGIVIAPSSSDKNLGNIQMATAAAELQGVVVTAQAAPTMRLDIDKKVFNVEKNIVSAGG